MANVVTLTLNPCFDLTLYLDTLDEDDVNRVRYELRESAGKGVNVACVLTRFGIAAKAVAFAGEDNLDDYIAHLPDEVKNAEFVRCKGHIRENLTICAPGRCMKINRAGFSCTDEDYHRLTGLLEREVQRDTIVVISGSLPKGFSVDMLAQLCDCLRDKGARIALDCDCVKIEDFARIRPWMIKPNMHELHALTGASLDSEKSILDAVHQVHAAGVENILLSLGGEGLAFSGGGEFYRARVPKVEVKSTVGAGDSSLSGYLYGYLNGEQPAKCVQYAAAFGTAAVTTEGTGLLTSEVMKEIFDKIMVS